MKKGSYTNNKFLKYIVSGVLLFSMLGASGCDNKKLDELSKQVEELKEQISAFESDKSELESLLTEAQEKITELKNLSDNKQLTIDELKTTIAQLQQLKKELEDQVGTLNEEKADLQATIDELNALLDSLSYCTITFDLNYGDSLPAYSTQTIEMEKWATKPAKDPVREGYDFEYWFNADTGTEWNFTDNVKGDMTLKAKWTAKTYTITYETYGGTLDGTESFTVTYDEEFTLPGVSKANYSLSRWTLNGETISNGIWEIDIVEPNERKFKLECEWAKTNATITCIFNYPSGPDNVVKSVEYGKNYTLPSPTRTGYTFMGWKNQGKTVNTSGVWTGLDSIEVLAEWKANTYTLTLDGNGGTIQGQAQATATYDSDYKLPVCSDPDGKPFAGWFIGNKRITDSDGNSIASWKYTSNQTLKANYFNVISTKDDFLAIKEDPTATYGLINDIDFENADFESVATFSGTLLGLGYSIKNISLTSDKTTLGLFDKLDSATIEDINFEDCEIDLETTESKTTYYIGLLAGQAIGKCSLRNISVSNLEFDVDLNNDTIIAGGLIGIANNLDIENVTIDAEGTLKSTGNSAYFGGLLGQCEGYLKAEKYVFDGGVNIISTSDSKQVNAGGLVGLCYAVNLVNVTNNGTLTAYSENENGACVGGIIGKNRKDSDSTKTLIEGCSNLGTIISSYVAGGLIGYNSIFAQKFSLISSFNSGVVNNLGSGFSGGLIGCCSENVILTGIYNSGTVQSDSGYAGGLVGYIYQGLILDSCYSSGNISSLGGTAGGLIGCVCATEVTISDSYSLDTIVAKTYAGGIVGQANKAKITQSYVGGTVKISDDSVAGFTGGFIGYANSSEINHSFIFANLVGIENKTNSYIGTGICDPIKVYSAATLKSKVGDDIYESAEPVVMKIDINDIDADFITETLQFDNEKIWNVQFDKDLGIYPTLLCFNISIT